MYAVKRVDVSLKQVKCTCTKWVVGTTWYAICPFGGKWIAFNHLGGRRPSWPFGLATNDGVA